MLHKKSVFLLIQIPVVVLLVALQSLLPGLVSGMPLPKELVYTSSSIGSGSHTRAVGVADLITKYTSMRVTVKALGGPVVWLPLFQTGDADLGNINFNDAKDAYLGLGGYEKATKGKGFDFRILQIEAAVLVAPIVRKNSDVYTIVDLKGKKIPSEFGGNLTLVNSWKGFLANAGLGYKDVIPVPVTSAYGSDVKSAFLEGRIDSHTPGVGSGFAREIDAAVGIRYLPYDTSPEAVARGNEWFIGQPYMLEAGKYPGIEKNTYVRAHLIPIACRTDLPDEVVYQMAKTKWEHFKELFPVNPGFKLMTRELLISTNATVPYHPGAIKFYKEIGVWTDHFEALQTKLLGLK